MSCIVITNDATELRSTLKYLHPCVLLYKLNTDEYEVVLDSTDTYDKGEVIDWDCIDDVDLHLKGRDEQENEEEEEDVDVAPAARVELNPIGEGLRQRRDEVDEILTNLNRNFNFNPGWEVVEENVPEENN